jgi:hypothetical protein
MGRARDAARPKCSGTAFIRAHRIEKLLSGRWRKAGRQERVTHLVGAKNRRVEIGNHLRQDDVVAVFNRHGEPFVAFDDVADRWLAGDTTLSFGADRLHPSNGSLNKCEGGERLRCLIWIKLHHGSLLSTTARHTAIFRSAHSRY